MSIRDDLERLHRDDLDAFILDKFRHVSRNLAPLMHNTNKINILLETEDESIIIEAFYRWIESRPGAARDRLLLLLPAPRGSALAEAAAEAGALRDALLRSARGRSIDVQERSFVSVDSLRDVVARVRPHAVHIATHGDRLDDERSGMLEIQDGRGYRVELKAEDLADLVRQGHVPARQGPAVPLRLLTLAICRSDQSADALISIADCVLGMAGKITPDAVTIFYSTFYKALGDGDSVAVACRNARTSLGAHDSSLRGSPTLCERVPTIAERTFLPRRRP